ncbi:MAG: GHMP family kinase ATP-binding protein, partial [Planctomycetota bacterium]
MIISKTPYRISFFGGGTDYPVWYRDNGGQVLATTIDKYCYISCRYLPPFFDHKYRIVYSKLENVRHIREIQHSAVRAALEYMGIDEGVEIHHDGDLPAKTGLGSSSSFTVGLLYSLYALKGLMPTNMRLAKEAIYIERDVLNEHVGSQDQILAACGGFKKISFRGDDNFRLTPVILDRARLESLQDHIMLVFTGFTRIASMVARAQIQNTPNRKWELTTMAKMVDEALTILTEGSDILDFGRLMHESWCLKRSLTDRISNSEIDDIYERARNAGAIGGKLLGAGGGGFMIFFVEPDKQANVAEALEGHLQVPFRFDNTGSEIIFHHTPYDAVGRIAD